MRNVPGESRAKRSLSLFIGLGRLSSMTDDVADGGPERLEEVSMEGVRSEELDGETG